MISRNSRVKPLFLVICCLSAASVIVACGGGGSDERPVLATSSVKAAVEADRSSTPNGQLVTTVSSPSGNAAIGGDVSVAKISASAPTLLIGTDAAGNELLLRFEEGDGPLSADTTAYALVRLALGLADLPTDASKDQMIGAIRKSSFYPAAVAAVRASLQAGTAGGTVASPDVADKVALVAQDVLVLSSQAAAFEPQPRVMNAAIDSTPYYFIDVANAEKAWIIEPLSFQNRTFLYWHLSAKAATGSWESVALPMKSTKAQLIGDYAGGESQTAIQSPADRFTLTLDQNKDSQLMNATAVVTRSTFAVVEVLLGATSADSSRLQKCAISTSKQILASPGFAPLLVNFSPSGIADYVWDNKIDILSTIIYSCTQDADDLDAAQKSVLTRVTNKAAALTILKVYKAMKAARTAASAYGTLTQFSKYASYSQSVDICFKDGKISKCVDPVVPPVTPPVVVPPVVPPVGTTNPANCQPYLDPLATEFNAINARRPSNASLIADLQVVMYMSDKMINTLEQYCKADAANYATLGSYRDIYNSTHLACTQVASNPAVCVPAIAW